MTAHISGAFDSAPNNSATPPAAVTKEPKTLMAPEQKTDTAESAQRAKQAFGNATPLPPGDRYSGGALPAPPTAAQLKPATVNPFGSAPISASPANAKNDRIAPLPTSPND